MFIKSSVTVLLLASVCWAADGDKDSDKKSPKQLVSSSVKASEAQTLPRIWIGLTGSYTPFKAVHVSSNGLSDAADDTINATSSGGEFGGGLSVNARIWHSYWISVGAIYRFFGYDWMFDSSDVNGDAWVERSRARGLDFPVLIRYNGKKFNPSKHTFYELGGTYRDMLSRTITGLQTDTVAAGAAIGPAIPSGVNYRKHGEGATVGAGFWAKDDFGIIVSPEVRYTRWFDDTFSQAGVLSSQKNQLEVTVSFGF